MGLHIQGRIIAMKAELADKGIEGLRILHFAGLRTLGHSRGEWGILQIGCFFNLAHDVHPGPAAPSGCRDQ